MNSKKLKAPQVPVATRTPVSPGATEGAGVRCADGAALPVPQWPNLNYAAPTLEDEPEPSRAGVYYV